MSQPGGGRKGDDLRLESDRLRIDFLNTELDLCFTFAGLAETRLRAGERASAEHSLADAEKGYATLLRYLSDPKHADHIGERDRRRLVEGMARLRPVLDHLQRRVSGKTGGEPGPA